MVGEDAFYSWVFQIRICYPDLVYQHVHAGSVLDDVLVETRIARDNDGLAMVVDAISVGGLDDITVILLERAYPNPVLVVDKALGRELFSAEGHAFCGELLVGQAYLDIRCIRTFEIFGQIFCTDWSHHREWVSPSEQPTGKPHVRNTAGVVRMKMG